ncbi:MAG: Ku protein [Gemmatimonadota bacterium]
MTGRAIWKGTLGFKDVRVPVKLFAAVENRNIGFRLLHEPDRMPLKQRMINPATEEPVEFDETWRGVEVEPGHYVMLTEGELDDLEPTPSRDIEVTRFVDPAEINHQWYDRPYYLGPDESDASYYALARALQSQAKEGVARWVMRKKRYLGALQAHGGHLMLITLRHEGEVVPASELEGPSGRALEKKERQMAERFIAALEEDFEPELYRDEYRERVARLIEIKQKGGSVEPEEYEEKEASDDLLELLEASLEAVS